MRLILKKFSFLVSVVLCLLFCSCLLKRTDSENKKIRIGFAYSGRLSEPYASSRISIRKSFSDTDKFILNEANATFELKNQILGINRLINKGIDYLIIDPVMEHGLEETVKHCIDMNIPVILCCGRISLGKEYDEKIISEIRSDYYKEGETAVKCLELYSKGKKSVQIVVFNDVSDSTSARERTEAINSGVEKNVGWKIISRRETNGQYDRTKELMGEILKTHRDIDAVFVESEKDYYGVIDELFKHGKMPGEDVYIFSFEDTASIIKMVNSGVVNFAVHNGSDNGSTIYDLIEKIENGKSYRKLNLTESTYIYSNKAIDDAIREKNEKFFAKIFK